MRIAGVSVRAALSAAVVMTIGMAAWPAGATAAGESPADAVRATREAISRIIHDATLREPGMRDERRRRLDEVIGQRLSYEEMSRRVLGPEWPRLNVEERGEFIRAFRALLCNMYAHKIEDYGGEPMVVLSERVERGIADVRARMALRKNDVILDFRLVDRDGEWRVFDIVTDGISLIGSYRQQFQRVLRLTSYPELLQKLRDATERSTAALARY